MNGNSVNVYRSNSFRKHRKKLVIVGDGACGKTSLLMVQSGQPFPEDYVPTIFENYICRVAVSKEREYELSLWDTAGQEDYDRLRPLSYPDTDVILLAFAVTDRNSFGSIREKVIRRCLYWATGHGLHESIPAILVGTKIDLRHDEEVVAELARIGTQPVTYEEGIRLAQEISSSMSSKVKYFDTSAMTGEGVHELFAAAAKIANKPKKKMRQCYFL